MMMATQPQPRLVEPATLARRRMSALDVLAVVAYRQELSRQFHANARSQWRARVAGNVSIYRACTSTAKALYREIQEINHALSTGLMPV